MVKNMTSQFNAESAISAMTAKSSGSPAVSPLRDASFEAARAIAARALPRGAEAAVAAVADVFAQAEALWAEIKATPAFALGTPAAACRKGCGWCCHQRVGATAVEVLHIAGELRRHAQAESLIARLDAWNAGRPCVFLVEGACAIYALRPLKCRSLYQVDARWCMTTYAKLDAPLFGPPPSHVFQVPPKDVFDGAVFGLALPFHLADRDCPGVDFIPALKGVIHRPDAVAAWWRGDARVFPTEVRLHDWFPPKTTARPGGVHRKKRPPHG